MGRDIFCLGFFPYCYIAQEECGKHKLEWEKIKEITIDSIGNLEFSLSLALWGGEHLTQEAL